MKEENSALLRMSVAGLVFLLMVMLPERGFLTGKVHSAVLLLLIVVMILVTPYKIAFRRFVSFIRGDRVKR